MNAIHPSRRIITVSTPQRRKSSETRQKVLSATIALLAERGSTATGLNQIAERSGVSYGSVYNQFRQGKAELIAAAVHQAGTEMATTLHAAFFLCDSLPEACDMIFTYGAVLLERDDFASGCPIGTAAGDGHSIPLVNSSAQEAFEHWEQLVADGAVGFGATPADAARFASTVLSLYEGALLIARVHKTTTPLEHAGMTASAIAADITSAA